VGRVTGDWTLAELVRRAAQALADGGVRAPNGRVTQLPDARMIRWYSTIGIVDKPSGFRGRTALYGYRHLLQLVAIKRLQAQGQPLAEIQARLTGATEATLGGIAGLDGQEDGREDGRAAESTVDAMVERPRFWATQPAASIPTAAHAAAVQPAAVPPAPAALVRANNGLQGTLHGVGLAGGAMLLVPATVHPDQVAAIRRAAQPLLEYLSTLGLLNPDEGAHA
jgi:DNA-binding transcriptional MerR regulator